MEFHRFIYPNHLDQQNAVALPGNAIVLDLFKLHVINSKKPSVSFKAMLAVDLATAEIIAHDVYRILNGKKGEAPAHKVIRTLQEAFTKRTFENKFILHTDRGPQFTSQEWTLFVEKLGATGSMSNVARPKDNAVAERTIRTIKTQLKNCTEPWPQRVKSLAEIKLVFEKKVAFYNHEFKPKRACGITCVELRPALDAVEHLAPPRVIAHSNGDFNHKAVIKFKQQAVETSANVLNLSDHPYYMLRTTRDDVKHIKTHFGHQLEQQTHELKLIRQEQSHELKLIRQELQALAQGTRHKKPLRKRLPLRDPANNTVYNWFMLQPRRPKQQRIAFLRFRLAITLLRHTGMRAAEVAEVTDQQIETAIKHGHLDITLAKTRRTHRYVFTPAAREALSRLHVERSQVFALHQKLAANIRGNHWVAFLNSNLQPAVKQFGLNIKSHSFRVGYVTHLLRYAPVQHVAAIAGHSDIRSTIAYNRYVPDSEHVIELLERGTQGQESLAGNEVSSDPPGSLRKADVPCDA